LLPNRKFPCNGCHTSVIRLRDSIQSYQFDQEEGIAENCAAHNEEAGVHLHPTNCGWVAQGTYTQLTSDEQTTRKSHEDQTRQWTIQDHPMSNPGIILIREK
jgi:hypothetical protein